MKKFCIATSFEEQFLEKLNNLSQKYRDKNSFVEEIYGSLPKSIIGSGRPSWSLPKINQEELKKHTEKAHSFGFKFNYLLNAPCLGNLEYNKEGRKEIIDFIKSLTECRIDIVTITIPFLIELVKENFPQLKISTSIILNIDSIEKAVYYEKLGVDRITLDFSLNRDFRLLKNIREKIKVDLEIILNDVCLLKCPLRYYHFNVIGHSSQQDEDYNHYKEPEDPALEKCSLIRIENPSEFIRSPWIRPEDVNIYADLGINYFKIAGRDLSTKLLLERANAYLSGDFAGNLISITEFFNLKVQNEPPLEITIDNKTLSNFIDFFQKKQIPCSVGCFECNYCEEISKKVLKMDEEIRQKYIFILRNNIKERILSDFEVASKHLVLEENFFQKIKSKITSRKIRDRFIKIK